MALNIDEKFEGKLTCAFKNDMKNMQNFHQSTWKSPNWDFDGILLSKVENLWAENSQGSYLSGELKLVEEFKIDMRNLTNVDLSTRKSERFAL